MNTLLIRIAIFILTGSFLFVSPVHSQDNDYKFNHIDSKTGLSNLSVSCFAKDELGFIWMGTEDGLSRFDGKNIKIFRHIEGEKSCISNNNIFALLATENYLWIGNEGYGVDRYNLETDEFENFKITTDDETIAPKNVNTIVELKNKNVLIGADNGLFIFDHNDERLKPYFGGEAQRYFAKTTINSIMEDDEKIWLGTDRDIFCIYTENKSYVHFQSQVDLEHNNQWVQHIVKGPDNRFYVLKQNWLFILDSEFEKVIMKKEFDQYMTSCMFDIYGRLWIVGDGLVIFNGKEFLHLKHDPVNPYSVSDKLTKSVYIDNEGIIWVGTWNNGVSYFNPENERHRITNIIKRTDGKGLPENPVDILFEDTKNRIWIGTNWGGIAIYDFEKGDMSYLNNSHLSVPKLSSNLNYSALSREDKIWLGTFRKGLDCFDINTERITNYPISVVNGQMPKINKIVVDSTDLTRLFLATEAGLIKFNTATAESYYFSPDEYNLPTEEFLDICYLEKNKLLIVADKVGLFIFDSAANTFEPYLRENLSSNILNTLKIDHENKMLLIGANNGLNVLDFFSNNVHVLNKEHGLSNENVVGILKDKRNYYWLSTVDGLCLIDLKRRSDGEIVIDKLRNLGSADGLVGNQFRERASLLTSDGKVLFGCNSGLSIFDPEIFSFSLTPPKILISDIKIFNQSVKVNSKNDDAVLNKSVFYTSKIELSHHQNSLSFDFTALDYFNNQNLKFKYKLEGFDQNWINSSSGTAVYTNLNPGNYNFKVKLNTESFSSNEVAAGLAVNITPPFYKTSYFIFISIAFLVGAVFTFYFLRLRYYKNRQLYLENVVAERTNELRLVNENLLEKNKEVNLMAKRVHEADEMKLRFFSNVHHEFRTALSLIIGPVEQLKQNKSILDKIGDDINVISSNAKRLFGFVNEILEYRKIDAGKLNLNLINGDAINFLKEIKSLFDCKAKELEIDYAFNTTIGSTEIYFDSQKFEHIIFNLLSNAFKYTEAKGTIRLEVSTVKSCEKIPYAQNNNKSRFLFTPELRENKVTSFLEVTVIDNGVGFKDKEHIKLIWERFYRMPNKNLTSNVGSGIGLALTKELTLLHNGLVSAETNEAGGATFRVWFPMGNDWFADIDNVFIAGEETPSTTRTVDVQDSALNAGSKVPVPVQENSFIPTVLVIEDNSDIHLFLNNHLTEYNLRFCDNGKDGLEMAKDVVPDLIVCDIMLPDIHGYHIVKELKNHVATSHIPIIMLTALVGEDNIIKALNIGADDYVTKPFTLNTLKARINNLLQLREKLREIYSLKSNVSPKEISANPVDQEFYTRLNDVILENVENYDFSVVNLAEVMGMSRIQLYRKVNSLTKKGPADMIRKIRLNHSKSLLKNRNLAVADVAIKVGYSESSSFIRAFTQEYGISPLSYAKKTVTFSKSETA